MIIEIYVGYMAYEIIVVLPQVTKWWWRYNRKYTAFIDGGFNGAYLHYKKNPKAYKPYKDPYIPPTFLFSEYREDYLRRNSWED